MFIKLLFNILLTVSLSVFLRPAYADLMISPMRIALGEQERAAEVVIINSGNTLRKYRIEWRQLAALPEGGYRELTEIEKQRFSGLDRVIRISPKQVSLAPGQRQSIKLQLRNTGSFKNGEYRSHLAFVALPKDEKDNVVNRNPSIQLNVLMSYTMPVVFRTGPVVVNPSITNISLVYTKQTDETSIKVDLFHNDLFSTHGRLVASWTPKNGTTRQVGLLNNYNFYPEIKSATTQFPWKDFKLEPGTLEVRYEGQAEFSGLLLGQKTLTITQQMINSTR